MFLGIRRVASGRDAEAGGEAAGGYRKVPGSERCFCLWPRMWLKFGAGLHC